MLAPPRVDLSVYAGSRNRMNLVLTVDGVPADLRGAEVSASCRGAFDGPVAIDASVRFTGAERGRVSLSWDGEEVLALLDGRETWTGVWDVQVRKGREPLPTTFAAGTFTARMKVSEMLPDQSIYCPDDVYYDTYDQCSDTY